MTAAQPDALVVDRASKRFGDATALDGVSITVGRCDLLALVGPSGCGKTTLLRTIAGLVGVDTGSIRLDGELVDDGRDRLPSERRDVGLVFQDHSLFPHLTAAENVAFGIRNTGRRETKNRALAALDTVRLSSLADRYPHELSGGERQRVALARALAPRPKLMLLDEPFASLDPNLRDDMRRDVTAALRTTETPAVFVTHDQRDAMAVGDQVAVMRAGSIQQVGTPYEVFHRPANRFVAAFMGTASFLAVQTSPNGPMTALGPVSMDGSVAEPKWAMVRADDVIFTPDPAGEAVVAGSEFGGTSWNCGIRMADGTWVTTMRSHLDPLELGTRGRVALAPGHTLVPIAGE